MNEKKNDNAKKDTSGKMNVKMSSETGRTQTPVNNAGKKSKTKFSGLMYFIFVVSVSVILACLAWSAATDVLALKSDDVQATIVLEKGLVRVFRENRKGRRRQGGQEKDSHRRYKLCSRQAQGRRYHSNISGFSSSTAASQMPMQSLTRAHMNSSPATTTVRSS